MGLFGRSCPLEKSYIKVYGIHPPRKWKKEDCLECEFSRDGKCDYKKMMSRREQLNKRGSPALVKKTAMDQAVTMREKSEQEALKHSGFSSDEVKEYWEVSREYDRLWESSSPNEKQEILDSLGQWKVYLENGDSPLQADEKVKIWLKERARFREDPSISS